MWDDQDLEPQECAECGHLHWYGWPVMEYVECPLASEGCDCFHGPGCTHGEQWGF
jgi:hypothetical protein